MDVQSSICARLSLDNNINKETNSMEKKVVTSISESGTIVFYLIKERGQFHTLNRYNRKWLSRFLKSMFNKSINPILIHFFVDYLGDRRQSVSVAKWPWELCVWWVYCFKCSHGFTCWNWLANVLKAHLVYCNCQSCLSRAFLFLKW